jgi:hypothetical protein
MAANEALNALNTTDSSNTPSGSDTIGSTLDDELRSIKANIARSARQESTATQSAAATLAVTTLNKIVPVSGSAGGSTTITLPAAATAKAGFKFTAWKTDSTNNVVLDGNGGETINGATTYTLATQYEAATLVTNGTSWSVESVSQRSPTLADDSVTTAKIADNAVTLAKLEHGTSGDILYYSGSGAPARLAKGSDGQTLALSSGIPAWSATYSVGSENLYTAHQRMTLQTDSSSSNAVTFDFAGGDCYIDLTENITSITISNLPENAWATVVIQQGSGARTVTGWPAAVKWPAATAPTISTTDNAYDVISLYKKGSDIIASVSQDHR